MPFKHSNLKGLAKSGRADSLQSETLEANEVEMKGCGDGACRGSTKQSKQCPKTRQFAAVEPLSKCAESTFPQCLRASMKSGGCQSGATTRQAENSGLWVA